ncbi:unnamed protein product [Brassicogethes aeneus]|uniref:BHLH domain-containing protein n=1 Tax=Brassicogethes aeneus TaxID=1431903 RepID=A0A9P0FRN4_BRAAE|nr:unnamed protein product [Brassicogethes aeneus]
MTYANCELRDFNKESTKMSISVVEDMGFCSGEDYLESDIHSPTDTSEDSLEVKITPIQSFKKRKIQDTFSGPLKKRMCLKVKAEEIHPFRPWSPQKSSECMIVKNSAPIPGYFRPPSPVCEEPVALVKKVKTESVKNETCDIVKEVPRVPVHPVVTNLTTVETEKVIFNSAESFPALQSQSKKNDTRREQRNYKNMTRERRIEANARERTRVHTISAAFDTLRKSIPSYSHNQKLSKLSVLRIACSYIMTLSSIVSEDDKTTEEHVDMVTKTIQREGKLRKKKDDND